MEVSVRSFDKTEPRFAFLRVFPVVSLTAGLEHPADLLRFAPDS